MTTTAPVPIRLTPPQATAACICAAVALVGLGLFSLYLAAWPVGADDSVRTIAARLDALEAGAGRTADALTYPPGAMCSGASVDEARALAERLRSSARGAKLVAVQVSATPLQSSQGVRPIEVLMDANGDTAGAVTLLTELKAARPSLLFDRVDLVANGTFVHLHFAGRAYCR